MKSLTKRKVKLSIYLKNNWLLYAMLFLPFAYYIIFKYGSMFGLIIAFKDYNMFLGVRDSEFVGLANFVDIFRRPGFFRAVRNTLILNGVDLILGFPLPIILALLLDEIRNMSFKKATQTIIYIPHFLSWVIVGGIMMQVFATNSGAINIFLKRLGITPIPFLTDEIWWIFTYFIRGVWQGIGWGAIIYMAAISGIDPVLYEAAKIDGCNKIKMIIHITIPSIMTTIVILLLLRIGKLASIGFEKPFILGNSLVNNVSDVLSTYVYRIGIQNSQFSTATTVGLFQSIINFILIISANYFSKAVGEEGIW